MSTSREIIGRKIKNQRKKKNLTQQELADLLQVDRQYVWRLENGKINMTLDYLDKIIFKLNCKHEDFFNNNSNS
jgi:transcriptional regulator with XRE-family HTH domain